MLKGNKNTKAGVLSRGGFIRSGLQTCAGVILGAEKIHAYNGCTNAKSTGVEYRTFIPLPMQIVIDDVGWWSGRDGSACQEPYRSGIDRDHVPEDYQAIVELGKRLGVRPQAAMVLCEWDKYNILKELPTATWMGENWNNSKWVGPWMEEVADIIRKNQDHFEITLHGVGHEYWEDNVLSRAEWADEGGIMRDPGQVEKHLDFFAMIMAQHQLGQFPSSFVPAAFRHSFGVSAGREISIAEILLKRGITYINTPFQYMANADQVENKYLAFDGDVLTINRGYDLMNWDTTGELPDGVIVGPTCGMHWANLIHPDPERNMEIVDGWVKLLAPLDDGEKTMLAPHSGYFRNQLMHSVYTGINQSGNEILIDFSELDKRTIAKLPDTFTIKASSKDKIKFNSFNIDIISQNYMEKNNEYLYSLELRRDLQARKLKVSVFVEF